MKTLPCLLRSYSTWLVLAAIAFTIAALRAGAIGLYRTFVALCLGAAIIALRAEVEGLLRDKNR